MSCTILQVPAKSPTFPEKVRFGIARNSPDACRLRALKGIGLCETRFDTETGIFLDNLSKGGQNKAQTGDYILSGGAAIDETDSRRYQKKQLSANVSAVRRRALSPQTV